MKTIWFDMDGTIYPLYDIAGWLDALKREDMTIFNQSMMRKSLPQIREALRGLIENGWQVGVITWAPKDVKQDSAVFQACAENKYNWLTKYCPELLSHNNFFCVEYGLEKAQFVRSFYDTNILVDDNKMVRKDWRKNSSNFITINASRGYVKELRGLIG